MKKISFIIPVYNDKIDDIKNAIDSIVKQNIKQFEIIIINDGSKDKAIDEYCHKISQEQNYIKYIYQENSGSAVARNSGLDAATGEFISFVDADDFLSDDYSGNLKKCLDDENDVSVFDYSLLTSVECIRKSIKNKLNKEKIYKNILFDPNEYNDFMFGSIWGKLFKKSFLEENNIRFIPRLRKAQDRMFMLTVFCYAKQVKYYPFNSYIYRANIQSITHKMNYNMIEYYKYLYDDVLSFCTEKNINKDCYKYFTYYVINELLLLSIFHIDNKKKNGEVKKEYKKVYKEFNLKNALNELRYSDFASTKDKIKLFLFKTNMIFLLRIYFKLIQHKHNKKTLNKGE